MVLALCAGVFVGLIAAMPILAARLEQAPLGRGLASLIFSFLFLSVAIFAARHMLGEAFMAFSITSVLAYLASVAVRMVHGGYQLA